MHLLHLTSDFKLVCFILALAQPSSASKAASTVAKCDAQTGTAVRRLCRERIQLKIGAMRTFCTALCRSIAAYSCVLAVHSREFPSLSAF